ncbi:MAG: UDP-N-acetylmuramoyl-L-alanine--D-glutamate ligase [Lachnospiraceae bacterium]|nr:UDP-N-acetylmuramoyl-L-alanine--D-glutamate ligase [Lachnospiraceae bacterium]
MAEYMVAGSGISGISAVRLLLGLGKSVLLYDGNVKLDEETVRNKVFEGEESLRSREGLLSIYIGELTADVLRGVRVCVLSPGIAQDSPFMDIVRICGIEITGEVELAYTYAKGKLAAITGTNGKTTTTSLVGEIVRNYNPDTFVVGNIGIPYAQEALKTKPTSATVIEISSFMMETAVKFKPDVSAILNITPDHLNRHKTMECYIAMKERIAANQTMNETCVLNHKDAVLREFGEKLIEEQHCKVVFFDSSCELGEGLFLRGDDIIMAQGGSEQVLMNVNDMNLIGVHNYENVMAAIAISYAFGVPMDIIIDTVKHFKAVEHRIEYVETIGGVKYYNDSKGTNPDAAIQAIKAMRSATVLIGGGYDKGSEYDEWIEAFDGKVKKLVLIGQTKEKIAQCCDKHGFSDYVYAETFEEAMEICFETATEGDNVLLSPACASWGMFDNYEQRGRIFKEIVRNRLKNS